MTFAFSNAEQMLNRHIQQRSRVLELAEVVLLHVRSNDTGGPAPQWECEDEEDKDAKIFLEMGYFW